MMDSLLQNRKYLHERHRLSHQQIDRWLGENRSSEFIQEKMKRLELVRLFLLITDKFRQKNIPFVCLKGPLLSLRLYGDPAVRMSVDIDLLIDRKNLEGAIKLMQAEGFGLAHDFSWPEEQHRQELFTRNAHHIGFFHRQQRFCVEVHWVLTSKLAIPMKRAEKIFAENLMTIAFAGREFTVMNKEFELLFLLIHGARHGWNRLKWLADINEYTRQKIDKDLFIRLVKQFKAKRIVSQANCLLEKYFNSRLNVPWDNRIPNVMIRLAEDSINKPEVTISLSIREIIKNFQYQWYLFPCLHYKLIHLTHMFVRQGDVVKNNLPNKTAYFFYRPYSFIKRRVFNV